MTDRQPQKTSRPLTPQRLENIALHYLERFSASTESLRRVLLRRVERSAQEHGTDREEAAGWVNALVERYVTSGMLNDAVFAEAKAASLHRRGGSTRMIRQKLAAKGVGADDIDHALDERREAGDGEPDLEAALALCRRRRLGPCRPAEKRAEMRDKDLAALGRAGFDYATARAAVDRQEEED
jgi:regulatory protein